MAISPWFPTAKGSEFYMQTHALEPHYPVKYYAELWHCHRDTIRPWFENHPGVLKIVRPETRLKRGYTTLRIPVSVAEDVHAKMCRLIPSTAQ